MMDPRPNILFITSDQQHHRLLGCQNPAVQTPNLDWLAARGCLFERAYCPNPTCTPTRASLITGQYPSQHGAWSLGTNLSRDVETVGGLFQNGGYRTSLIGKAHFEALAETPEYPSLESYPRLKDLDFWRSFDGPYFGFQKVRLCRNHADEYHAGEHYGIWMEERGLKDWEKYFPLGNPELSDSEQTRNPIGAWDLPEEFHYNHFIVKESAREIDLAAASGEPFFLWSSFPDPHPPYLVPEPWASMFDPNEIEIPKFSEWEFDGMPPHFQETKKESPDFSPWAEANGWNHGFHRHWVSDDEIRRSIATYYGMMAFTDHAIGQILKKLEASGLAENTLVVFTSDHGHFYGQHGLYAKGPFHFEDLIRVPLIARWPGKISEGSRSDDMVSLVDCAPTFLGAAGLPVPSAMTGLDLHERWTGRPDARMRDHVLVENRHQPTKIHVRTYVDARYKITTYFGERYGELFDLAEDPGELENLWDDPNRAGLKLELLHRMVDAHLGREPIPMPRIAGA